jgi:Bacterial transcriptional activator domain
LAPHRATSTPPVVVTRPPGYVLAVSSSSVDAVVFETSVKQAWRAAAVGQPALAAERYRQALALWRGEAYAEFTDHPVRAPARNSFNTSTWWKA